MKIFKLVIGIISILVFGIGISLSLVNSFIRDDIRINEETIGGGSAVVLAFSAIFLIAGIISITTRKNKSRCARITCFCNHCTTRWRCSDHCNFITRQSCQQYNVWFKPWVSLWPPEILFLNPTIFVLLQNNFRYYTSANTMDS